MKSSLSSITLLVVVSTLIHLGSSSVIFPPNLRKDGFGSSAAATGTSTRMFDSNISFGGMIKAHTTTASTTTSRETMSSFGVKGRAKMLAMAIPGNGVAEQIFVGGFANFLSIYNNLITVRILLSWFPQAMGIGALQPLFVVTDPFLNLFRGLIPPVFGLDLSPIAGFFLLNLLGQSTAAVGCEMPPSDTKKGGAFSCSYPESMRKFAVAPGAVAYK
eukprot:CAMPEP_0118693302 /NCGR_PEP_ID=MMETSP0800-20121206/11829_1 /TAXON_ID=210618 ORGANISM="Striatella unipunctata, Strain CCMP2910" /NCGR_SAMPLE_ID=MMETSP0800 /ASSEMBLY_ACC=CAM_ASM_000638 /LENGTH=216 /DNA_ID=CAMNT_0006591515 /DNA_START=37 /DNA_END=687 /DNA_ORIENTATION=+